MATLQKVSTIKGAILALDRRQVEQPFVVDGKNYAMTASGPSSGFSGRLVSQLQLSDRVGARTFNINNELLLFTTSGILKYDVTSGRFYPAFTFSVLTAISRWAMALVGNVYYFTYKGSDLISYNPTTRIWTSITANVPTGLLYLAESHGRLICLGADAVAWSAIDNGADLATSTVTGAGTQALSIVGSGEGQAVESVADGFITYTTTGIMKSEAIDNINPFRHYQLSDVNPPISIHTHAHLDTNKHVYLSAAGLYITEGKKPEKWQPVMSEYFTETILPIINLAGVSQINLEFIDELQQLYISYALTSSPNYYTKAFVLYVPTGEWGSFDRPHSFVGQTDFTLNPDAGYNHGWIDDVGYIYKFVRTPYVESPVTEISGKYLFRPELDIPCETVNGNVQAVTLAVSSAVDESIYGSSVNYFDTTDFVTWAIADPVYASIDSFVHIGVYHLSDETFEDNLINVSDVAVGLGPVLVLGDEDWLMSNEPDEDWLTGTFDEDWGQGISSTMEFTCKALGTLDGYSQWATEIETLIEVNRSNQFRQYAANVSGIYNIIQIEAQALEQSFHLKSLAVSGSIIGRL